MTDLINELRAQLAAALAKLDLLERSVADLSHPNMRMMLADRDEMQRQRDAERTALKSLKMFVEHNASCGVWSDTETRCTCGLTLALSLAAKLP